MAWKKLAAWKKGAVIGIFFGVLMIYLGVGWVGIIKVWMPQFILESIPETIFLILRYPFFVFSFAAYHYDFSNVSILLGMLVISLVMVVFYAAVGSLAGLILGKIMNRIKKSKEEKTSFR